MEPHARRNLLVAIVAAAIIPAVGFVVPAAQAAQGERMMTAGFDVSPGGTLEVAVHDAEVSLSTGGDDRVEVDVYLDAGDMDRGRERYERMNFRARLDDGTVRVQSDPVRGGWSWRDFRHFDVRVEVRLPERFDVDVRTGDGDVRVDRLEGAISLVSQDGDIRAERLAGEIRITTSDGDLSVHEIHGGRVEIRTSDGDIDLGAISAESIDLQSSDGDIRADVAAADAVDAHTADGDIVLAGIRGALTASTHDGDIDVDLDTPGEVSLQTGDGDVSLSLPRDAAVDLDLRGEDVGLRDGEGFTGTVRDNRIEGHLHGGGPRVRVRSGDGSVVLRLRGAR